MLLTGFINTIYDASHIYKLHVNLKLLLFYAKILYLHQNNIASLYLFSVFASNLWVYTKFLKGISPIKQINLKNFHLRIFNCLFAMCLFLNHYFH